MKKKQFILTIFILHFGVCFCQINETFFLSKPSVNSTEIGVFYYPFIEGVQMIEIDYQTAYYAHQAPYFNKGYVPPYHGKKINEYIFRDTTGQIVKIYNMYEGLDSISMVLKPVAFFNKENHITSTWDDYYQQGKLSGYYNVFQDDKQGVIDSLGNIVVPMAYNYITHKPNSFLIHSNSEVAIIPLSNLEKKVDFFDNYHERRPLIYFSKNEKLTEVFNYNKSTFTDLSNYEDVRLVAQGYEGLAWVKKNGLWGIRNFNNDSQLLSCTYDSGNYFSYFYQSKYRMVVSVWQNGKMGLISLDDNKPMVILDCKYDKIYASKRKNGPPYGYKEGYISVEINGETYEYEINNLSLTKLKNN